MKKYSPSEQSEKESIAHTVTSIMPMTDADLEIMFSILGRRQVKKKEFLLRKGEVCRNVYFVLNGFLRIYYLDQLNQEINYKFVDQGNFIVDFQSFLTHIPSRYYIQAMKDSTVFVLSHKDIHANYAASHTWSNFGRLIAEGVFLEMNERIEMMLFMTPEQRYEHLVKTKPSLIAQVPQRHLSTFLGIKPESLSRLKKRLQKRSWSIS
ncbi:MAG: Crp/Fnr family transcriptional regulator [Bacteroidota bacterium]